MNAAVWWIRRDLRLYDNQALDAALRTGNSIVPVFVLDPTLLDSPYVGPKRLSFLFTGLRLLDQDLLERGSRLIVRRGDPIRELTRVCEESQAGTIFAEPDYSTYACRRDAPAGRLLPVKWVGSPALRSPGSVLKADGQPYVVYTPFSRTWQEAPPPERSARLPSPKRLTTPVGLASEPIPDNPALDPQIPFKPGEKSARESLQAFVEGENAPVYQYGRRRDRLDLPGTSQLSPYLRFGMLSIREAVTSAYEAINSARDREERRGAQTWLNELIWRDFYLHILYHFPRVRRENFRYPHIRWQNDGEQFADWCSGQTGYPVIDASMRQLAATGWMHNRARMIVASFLTKDLLIDWRWGEQWFMRHLVDGDPAANNGGWQWSAGTGTDAAPYFRIFNPISQSEKHDPQGEHIRCWIPELKKVPDEYLHAPWKMPETIQTQAGCRIGRDYPLPIVDHSWARERVLDTYSQAKDKPT